MKNKPAKISANAKKIIKANRAIKGAMKSFAKKHPQISGVRSGRKPQRVALVMQKSRRATNADVTAIAGVKPATPTKYTQLVGRAKRPTADELKMPIVALESDATIHELAGNKFIERIESAQFNNVMTASRMMTFLQCQRKHFWRYEVGLQSTNDDALPLRVGSAWARAMESRWSGGTYEDALAAACPVGIALDDYAMATISALLAAYYEVYGAAEREGSINPEVQFKSELGNGFTAQGKIDGLGKIFSVVDVHHELSAIIESKTTSDSVAPDSDYWMRCTFNLQVNQYIVEARKLGHEVDVAFYDVTRKPGIQPKEVNDLDEQGLKIVVDDKGNRQFKDNNQPRQTADKAKGWFIKSHVETPDEFCDRLYKDCLARPEFYFARREMPVIEQNLEDFKQQRLVIKNTIEFLRASEDSIALEKRNAGHWPRNVSEHTCDFCQFKSFCLQNLSVDINNPPQGFTVKSFNPELD